MPRSFMITHRRFGDDNDHPCGTDCITSTNNNDNNNNNKNSFHYNNSSTDIERDHCGFGDKCDERMHSDSPARDSVRSYVSYLPDSPEFKKRAIFARAGLEKSASVSDGESDSGCSTHADARGHEFPPELEYTWDCPSGFSLLLELMTQSPQRYSGRDVIDCSRDVKSPGSRLSKDDLEKGRIELDIGDVKKLEAHAGLMRYSEKVEYTNMHIHMSANDELALKVPEERKYIFEAEDIRRSQKDFANYPGNGGFPLSLIQSKGLDLSNPSEVPALTQTTPVYDIHGLAEQKPYQAQRRISFEEEKELLERVRTFSRPESPNDQPIDYSQLSSRRKETDQGTQDAKVNGSSRGRDDVHIKEESLNKVRRLSEDAPSAMKEVPTEISVTPKYEFILSPRMDGNGNIVLPQQQGIYRSPVPARGHDSKALRDGCSPTLRTSVSSYEHNNGMSSYVHQPSPLSGTPASPVSNGQHESVLDLAKEKFQSGRYDLDKAGRAQIPYHPKLKYLLAASQYAKAKAQQEEGRTQAARVSSPYHPTHQQNQGFSSDQTAQVEALNKLNEENSYNRGEVNHGHRIPSSDIFHTITSPPSHHPHNTNVFIFNPSPSFKSCPSSSDISKGSPLSEKQHTSIDIRTSLSSSSSQISKSTNGSHVSDQMTTDQSHDTPSAVSPLSPGQPLSPATLRDQQSALSELLFSSTHKPGIDPYACADCGKRYSTSSNLARHRQTHRSVCDKKARKCPHCDKVYVSMPAYSMHVRTHNQGCECPHCGKKFSRPWLLQGHIRTHTGEKPFGCPQCGKSFADKSNLRAHIQTHSTEKPYVCGRCGKAFALKSYLYKHEESSCMRGQRFRH